MHKIRITYPLWFYNLFAIMKFYFSPSETYLSFYPGPSVLFFKKQRNKIFRVIGLFTLELPYHLSFRLNGVFLATENNLDISHYQPHLRKTSSSCIIFAPNVRSCLFSMALQLLYFSVWHCNWKLWNNILANRR